MNTSHGGSNLGHYLQPTESGRAEMKAERAEEAARRAENPPEEPFVDNTPMGPLRTFIANTKKKSDAIHAAESAGPAQTSATGNNTANAIGIGGLVLLTSLFAPASKASAEAPDPALNQAFAVCMAHEGYAGATLTDVSSTNVAFSTPKDGPMSIDRVGNKLTGKVWAWGQNKQQFQIEYAGVRIETVLPDTSLLQGYYCWRKALSHSCE